MLLESQQKEANAIMQAFKENRGDTKVQEDLQAFYKKHVEKSLGQIVGNKVQEGLSATELSVYAKERGLNLSEYSAKINLNL